ncbi:hypothetical protein KC19_VG073700 [Ceratodon purpureus]|uniref:Uncharacterized protein n=1 Tax=Ceratodon purpureus TaxID=3225 RepID=A0A8T0HN10_CERPU|nr:hypothetical protein KC19_VG073700 [Ceratodon purpureus]
MNNKNVVRRSKFEETTSNEIPNPAQCKHAFLLSDPLPTPKKITATRFKSKFTTSSYASGKERPTSSFKNMATLSSASGCSIECSGGSRLRFSTCESSTEISRTHAFPIVTIPAASPFPFNAML